MHNDVTTEEMPGFIRLWRNNHGTLELIAEVPRMENFARHGVGERTRRVARMLANGMENELAKTEGKYNENRLR